ncbi:phage transcriptional regulator domain protein, partial [Escherichia coli EC1848]
NPTLYQNAFCSRTLVRQYPGQFGKLLVAHPIQFFIKAICFAHDSQEDQKLVLC